jgi:hypothetical protein
VPAARRSISLACAVLAVATLCAIAAGCGLGGTSGEDAGARQQRTLRLARFQLSHAATALLDRDREGFLQWIPTDGGTPESVEARTALGEVYDTLSRLPWRTFSFDVTPRDGDGVYRVRGTGQLGDAGPPDRIAVIRYLRLMDVADGAVVLADETPEDLRSRYLMALHDPFVLQRPGLIVLGDRRARARAKEVTAAAVRARPRLAGLGVDTHPTVVVTVYGSAADVRDALGIGASAAASRLVFFSHPALRVSEKYWPTYDVGVTGPWMRDLGYSMDGVLGHELAHAYTLEWFGEDEPPALLVEGIAQAAEGLPASSSLREEVATGDQLWPLPESFADTDVWDGGDAEGVSLGYQVGGALVGYVVSRWGADELRPFVQAVAAAEPSEAGMDEALGDALGVDWREFYAGWRRYVLGGD